MPPRRRSSKATPVPESPWLVRKIKGRDGKPLARPTLYGKVLASSEEAAVQRFLGIVRIPQMAAAFDAVPFRDGAA